MPRYPEDDYGRERTSSRREQPRERERDRGDRDRGDRHTSTRNTMIDDRMDLRDTRMMDDPMDIQPSRMDPRSVDPRANAGARVDRPERGMDRGGRETGVLYRDPRTGQIYQDAPPRSTFVREDRMERDDIPQQGRRNIIDTAPPVRDRDEDTRPVYNEYFVPGDGIDREVIQHEICKYLGQDATCRPYRHQDGRTGYLVRAYRAFTSQMIRSLQDDSSKWVREREKRAKSGRSGGSYAEMRDRQDSQQRTYETMDMDEDYPPSTRYRGEVDPRAPTGGRHASTPVTSGYGPEPGYPAQYSLSTNQSGNYNPASEPRIYAGNSTPPNVGRAAQPPYTQPGYPARTSGAQAPLPVTQFRDPRTGEMVSTYPPAPGYTTETARPRHR